MAYWRGIFARTAKRAAEALRIGSVGGIVTLVMIQAAIGGGLFYTTSENGAGIPTRIASFITPFALFPIYFVWFFFPTIQQAAADQAAEIVRLTDRIAGLEAESASDISIYVDLHQTRHIHPDHPAMTSYSAVIENIGPNYLTNCILKLSTANKFNLALYDRSWLQDASETFDLRPGQVKKLDILWTVTCDPIAPAYPQYHRPDEPDEPDIWPGTGGGEIIPADQTYFLFCEVLSANTVPARLTLRVSNDGEGWQIEALATGERPSFDA
ncbi:MAG: hypothetical protein WCC64_18925 [Aliidongia sp.]